MSRPVLRLDARRVDVLLMLAVTSAVSVAVASHQTGDVAAQPVAYLWAVGLGLLMLVRRSLPVLVLALTVLGFFSYYIAGFPAIGVAVPIAAAVYSAAEAGRMTAALVASLLVLGVSTAFRLLAGQSAAYVVGYELVGHAALIAAVLALGYSVRIRREIEVRTDQVTRLAAHQSWLRSEEQQHDGRLRLARELHDSIGHSLSVASLYAGVAEETPDAATRQEALACVRGAVSDSMSHLRSTVTLLRARVSEAGPEAPGLADVPRLLDPLVTAGYDVDVAVEDLAVAPEVAAAAFRVIQEAVTNTLRHSDATSIGVTVTADGPDRLHVGAVDNGTRTRGPRFAAGHGLAGMRERVAAVGGDLTVDATGEGWRVAASLPRGEPA